MSQTLSGTSTAHLNATDSMDHSKSTAQYTYLGSWPLHPVAWAPRRSRPLRLAVGSFLRTCSNVVELLQVNPVTDALERQASFPHLYPATKVLFLPDPGDNGPELLATTGDHLRLWEVSDDGHHVNLKICFSSSKKATQPPPITSFDWNTEDTRIIGTSCLDTTCSIWDIKAEKALMQLIAHDKPVMDIAFSKGPYVFGSAGADGSVRIFDMRSLDRSTILYESPDYQPTLRLSWSMTDPNYIAAILADSGSVVVLDVRAPSAPVLLLNGHQGAVNAAQWAPTRSLLLASAGDDGRTLVWDLSALPSLARPQCLEEPLLSYGVDGGVQALAWSPGDPSWVALCHGTTLQLLRL